MPTDMQFMHFKRYMETGVCACGKHESEHVNDYEELKNPDAINCKLLKSDVPVWNAVTAQFQRGGAPG